MPKLEMVGDVLRNVLGMLSDLTSKLQHGGISSSELSLSLQRKKPFGLSQERIGHIECNLRIFQASEEFKHHYEEHRRYLIDPNYESERVPDTREDLNGAFRHLTADMLEEEKQLFEELVVAAFLLGKHCGMSCGGPGVGAVYFDEDPDRPQWCRGWFRDKFAETMAKI